MQCQPIAISIPDFIDSPPPVLLVVPVNTPTVFTMRPARHAALYKPTQQPQTPSDPQIPRPDPNIQRTPFRASLTRDHSARTRWLSSPTNTKTLMT
ncbi:hypothetical protein COCSADRAFT_217192 [Bipolaris sorokiniana ND90Pr]|uniref:Uncharacterized protein n=1 Tax=Cochliobolus sativus (strain ND90Pr / ATCC 201652) TaxID=665912 RepID=M2TLS8_COCSN|nr:uncharacterized protein COCSADRAFT_217192 [Bipolaris sorokiniana ND90Pr]EMD70111.1 hypothetical protein COCSADRAFT_217192 [Bipolaris sorokiniana ND90Pr]